MYVLLSAVTIRPNLRFSEESLLKNYEHPQHPFKVEKKTVLNRGAFRFLIITIEFWGHRNNKATLLTTQWTWEFPRRHVYLPHKILSKFFFVISLLRRNRITSPTISLTLKRTQNSTTQLPAQPAHHYRGDLNLLRRVRPVYTRCKLEHTYIAILKHWTSTK